MGDFNTTFFEEGEPADESDHESESGSADEEPPEKTPKEYTRNNSDISGWGFQNLKTGWYVHVLEKMFASATCVASQCPAGRLLFDGTVNLHNTKGR